MQKSPPRVLPACVSFCLVLALLPARLPGDENRSKFNAKLAPGDAAPVFEKLPGVDGKEHSLAEYKEAKVVVVCFTSSLCTVVDIYEERLAAFAKEYEPKGVKFVAISCERRGADAEGLAGDIVTAAESGELERLRTKVKEHSLPFDFLYDGSQKTARAYGATATPTLFVLDGNRKIAYLGAFDDSFPADAVTEHYVRDAVDAVLAGREPEVKESLARGCRLDYADPASGGR
jgi:peroxiredoxin